MKYFVEKKQITEEKAIELLGGKRWFNNYMRVVKGVFNCGFSTYSFEIANNKTLQITK